MDAARSELEKVKKGIKVLISEKDYLAEKDETLKPQIELLIKSNALRWKAKEKQVGLAEQFNASVELI